MRYGSQIFWHQTLERELGPPFEGPGRADVAVVGGGYTGLWTSIYLKRSDPSIDVVVLEAEEIAFGASGRNGGFAMTLLDMSLAHLLRNYGAEAARACHEAAAGAVDEIGKVCADVGIDCDYERNGLLVVATNPGQEDRVRADLEAARTMGLDDVHALTGEEVRSRVASPSYRSALYEESCALVNPARLVAGLARYATELGVRVYEGSPVASIDQGPPVRLRTERGELACDRAVLATNAWVSRVPGLERSVVPLYTYIVLTEPLTGAQWDAVGWRGREGIEDKRNYVHYYRVTRDGRILWGGSDAVYYYGSRISPALDRHDGVFRGLRETFDRTFPALRGIRFTHAWGGPVAVTVRFMPIFGTFEGTDVHYGYGYCGHGVAPSNVGGRILSDLVLGRRTPLTELPFVSPKILTFPPEPLRWAGAEATRRALLRQDRQLDAGRAEGDMDPLILRVLNKLG